MKKIITLVGICTLLPACSMDLSGDASTSTGFDIGGAGISIGGAGISVDTGFGIGDDSGLIGRIGDGNFKFGDGKLF